MRRMTGWLYLGECLSLDTDNLPSAVDLPPVETPSKSNDFSFMFLQFEVGQAQIFGCACSKRKWPIYAIFGLSHAIF